MKPRHVVRSEVEDESTERRVKSLTQLTEPQGKIKKPQGKIKKCRYYPPSIFAVASV